jgi:AraC family transcriptional regulator of arabinose operon
VKDTSPPFQVRTAGCIDRLPYHSTPGTRQGDVMLTVFLAGRGTYRNSTAQIAVGPDMAGLVPPEDEGVLMADQGDPYLHYWCRFNGAYAVHMAERTLAERRVRFFPVANAEQIADHLRRMGHYMSRALPDHMGPREALLAQALVALASPPTPEGRPPIVRATVEEYLREHIAEPTNLSRMAYHFIVSRSTLCREVRRACGDTVQRMHEGLKVEWAKTLLSMGRFNVAAAARRVGYDDPFYFSRVFRRRVGVGPKRWTTGAQ